MHESIQDPLPLHHGDRVVLGRQNNYNFVYVDPREGSGQELIEHGEVVVVGGEEGSRSTE